MVTEGKVVTMLYDGDCGFCTHFIERWKKETGEAVVYRPYQEVLKEFPQVTEDMCREAVQLVSADGVVASGAHAIFKALESAGKFRILHWLYERVPLFGRISEFAYQFVAHRRMFFSRFFGGPINTCG